MSVPDHLIEKAARAANLEAGRQRGLAFEDDWEYLTEQERGGWRLVARAALDAVAGELRAEGARAERERIADTVKTMLGCMSRTPENQWSRACMAELLAAIREGVRDAS